MKEAREDGARGGGRVEEEVTLNTCLILIFAEVDETL